MSRAAIFIDGGYLFGISRQFGLPKIDMQRLVEIMASGAPLLRAFFYDCLPFQSDSPTPDERNRIEAKERFFYSLNRIPRFQVRLGRLAWRGQDINGNQIYEQKRVDILLATDLVSLSVKHLITDAVILAGDSDFCPAIEVAKQEGVVVHLLYVENCHRDLVNLCDERAQITEDLIDRIRMQNGSS